MDISEITLFSPSWLNRDHIIGKTGKKKTSYYLTEKEGTDI